MSKNIKVIAHETFNMIHWNHINLLKRAEKFGDFLIVGVNTGAVILKSDAEKEVKWKPKHDLQDCIIKVKTK